MTLSILIGVIVAFVISIFKKIYLLRLEPYLQERMYNGVPVSGIWHGELVFSDGNTNYHLLTIQRHGYNVEGKLECISGYSSGRTYTCQGEFRNMTLILNYEPDDLDNIETGTFTLRYLMNSGQGHTVKLEGIFSYYEEAENQIDSTSALFKKVESKETILRPPQKNLEDKEKFETTLRTEVI